MYKHLYKEFLKANPNKLFFSAHSHHLWPDITQKAVLDCWKDARNYVDDKWENFFNHVLPQTQKKTAELLNFPRPKDIAFATNTHELVFRLLSSLFVQKKIRVLTTDCEFHSFSRQINRLSEWDKFEVKKVEVDENFLDNFCGECSQDWDFIYLSQTFFNSGKYLTESEIQKIVNCVQSEKTIIVIDGYHSFAAIPIDLSELGNRVYFTAGGYKYAQAGEGVCFLTLPENCQVRPLSTGWFAGFEDLSSQGQEVTFSNDGLRFWGSTIEQTGFYRFNAVWELYEREGINIQTIHSYVQSLQKVFLEKYNQSPLFHHGQLIFENLNKQGHFFTLRFQSENESKKAFEDLKSKDIITDRRGLNIRFGLGLYQDRDDIDELFLRVKNT